MLELKEGLKLLAAGAATISLSGSGVGIGVVFAGLMHSVARNPYLMKQLFVYAILGFALSEAIALFGLMMAFLILFAF
jgi:F-type H+-transporting ATPase subunit c